MAGPYARILSAVQPQTLQASVYRHIAAGRDALATIGSLNVGGRWNVRGAFGAIYTSLTQDTARAELRRTAQRRGLQPSDLAPRELVLLRVKLRKVLNLTDPETLGKLGLTRDDLTQDSWSRTQEIARAAWEAGFEAVLVPSATGAERNLVVFPDHLGEDSVIAEQERQPMVI